MEKAISVIDDVGSRLFNNPEISNLIKVVPRVIMTHSFTDSGAKLKVVGVTQPGKQWEVRSHLLRELKSEFDKQKIETPYKHIKIAN